MPPFEYPVVAGWSHMDANGHMANTAFLALAVDARLAFLASVGFGPEAMAQHAIGPVIRRDDVEYFREVRLMEALRITLTVAGLSEDGSRFIMCNDVYKSDGVLAARLRASGGWLDLTARALTVPPPLLLAGLRAAERTPDYTVLESSIKRR